MAEVWSMTSASLDCLQAERKIMERNKNKSADGFENMALNYLKKSVKEKQVK